MTTKEGVDLETLTLLLQRAGLSPTPGELKRFEPALRRYLERVKGLRELDLEGEPVASVFRPEWRPESEATR